MNNIRKYHRCDVAGNGKIEILGSGSSCNFKIIDMSATGIRLKTTVQIQERTDVQLKIELPALLFLIKIDALGKVTRSLPLSNEYEYVIEFTKLNDSDRVAIDEFMHSACNILY